MTMVISDDDDDDVKEDEMSKIWEKEFMQSPPSPVYNVYNVYMLPRIYTMGKSDQTQLTLWANKGERKCDVA